MTEESIAKLQRPKMDDKPIWDMLSGMMGYPAVLVSLDLNLFSILAEKPRTVPEICDALAIAARPATALLSMNASLGLVRLQGDRYALTPLAQTYLLDTSPTSFIGYLRFVIETFPVYSVESLKKAVLTNAPQAYGGEDYAELNKNQAEQARNFTLAMHGHSMGPALAWPDCVDLSESRLMLDIGGGSGAHAIGAAGRWPDLQVTILDVPPVCEIAREIIQRHGAEDQVKTQACDYWDDAFPPADIHFYSNGYQNYPPEKCRFLSQKSFDSLEPGGRIIIHEILFDDDKAGPPAAATFNIIMLLYVEGQQYSGKELSEMLVEAGFADIEVKPTFGYWGIVTGRKL